MIGPRERKKEEGSDGSKSECRWSTTEESGEAVEAGARESRQKEAGSADEPPRELDEASEGEDISQGCGVGQGEERASGKQREADQEVDLEHARQRFASKEEHNDSSEGKNSLGPAEAGGHIVGDKVRVEIWRRREEGSEGEKVATIVKVFGQEGTEELDVSGFEQDRKKKERSEGEGMSQEQ